jgi:hypothetical protein
VELQLTDDIYYIVYNTYRGDRSMYEDNHFCHPSGVEECSLHTTKEIFDSPSDTEFYAVIDGGLVGFVAYHSKRKRVISFGLTISSRREGRAAEFMGLVRNFGDRDGLSVRVCKTNKRDIALLQSAGFAKTVEIDLDHVEMLCFTDELSRLHRIRREIESERRTAMNQFKKRIETVVADIGRIAGRNGNTDRQLSLFNY